MLSAAILQDQKAFFLSTHSNLFAQQYPYFELIPISCNTSIYIHMMNESTLFYISLHNYFMGY